MLRQVVRAVFSRQFLWHLASWKFWVWFVAIKALLHWIEAHPVLRRADLGGFDVAMAATASRTAERTVVVAITAEDVARTFAGRRPVPPDSLLRVVGAIARLRPAVLVIDVFTEDSSYASRAIPGALARIVWAQSADTTTGDLIPVLGGSEQPARSGFAAMMAEDDGLVRRVRLRFATAEPALASGITTLPLAAVQACPDVLRQWCRLSSRIPSDTASVALRGYQREPAFFTLEDVLIASADTARDSPLRDRIVVLGFADGSDQLATPMGIRPGPQVVADAIETLLDRRGLIRRMPPLLSWPMDMLAAILVAAVQFSLHSRPQLAALWTLLSTITAYFLSRLLLIWPGYWVSIVPVMAGMWVEQLLEDVKGRPHPKGPPAWMDWLRGRFSRAVRPPGVPPKDDPPPSRPRPTRTKQKRR
ncbi:MAG: CHASE2 domain-containing protein [Gemmatimonadaceae bacterium]